MTSPLLTSRAQPPEQQGGQLPGHGERQPALQSFEELGIPDSFRAAVENELTAGEQILWLGRPSRNPLVHPSKQPILLMGLGLIGLGLAVAVLSVVLSMGFFPIVFGSVLALLGLIFQLPRVVDPAKNCRSCYVVTNRRALLVEVSVWSRAPRAQSYLPHQLLGLERRNHPEVAGAGDLIFEYILALGGNSFDLKTGFMLQQGAGFGSSNAPKRIPRGFILLDQVREVEQLIRTTLLQPLENTLDEATPRADASEAVSSACSDGLIVAPSSLAGKAVRCSPCSAGDAASVQPCQEAGPIDAELKRKALADLDPNEQVVWLGQPVGNLLFVRKSGWLIGGAIGALIALVWLLGALAPAKTTSAVGHHKVLATQHSGKTATATKKEAASNLLFPLGLLCVSVGLALVPLGHRHFAGRTCYVLTNRRAVVYKDGLFGPTRDSSSPLEVAALRRSDSWLFSGHGDLIFRTAAVVTSSRTRGVWSSKVKTIHYGFLAIAQVAEVEKLVRETLIERFVDKLSRASSL